VAEPSTATTTTGTADGRIPTVVVDDVHVIYKVYGASTPGTGSPIASLKRMVTGKKSTAVREVHAVKGVSFVAHRGEAIGLIGSNGSGKSTLLLAIAGLLPVDGGGLYTLGQPSLLGVNAALMNDLSGERNVTLGCLAMGMQPAEVKRQLPEIVDFSGINERGDFASMPMRTYSSGMAARLRFSIAAAKKHDVLLIDEALATGDAKFRRRSEQRVRDLRQGAGTVFLVSHNNESIRDTCERSIWLESGVIRADGPTDDVVKEYERYMNS
jgi:teichoic acid transport system ATP-binding protein